MLKTLKSQAGHGRVDCTVGLDRNKPLHLQMGTVHTPLVRRRQLWPPPFLGGASLLFLLVLLFPLALLLLICIDQKTRNERRETAAGALKHTRTNSSHFRPRACRSTSAALRWVTRASR